MRALRVCNPSVRAVADELERDEIERWSSSLPQARVTRWGGMISTPDEYLQVNYTRNISKYLIRVVLSRILIYKFSYCSFS